MEDDGINGQPGAGSGLNHYLALSPCASSCCSTVGGQCGGTQPCSGASSRVDTERAPGGGEWLLLVSEPGYKVPLTPRSGGTSTVGDWHLG